MDGLFGKWQDLHAKLVAEGETGDESIKELDFFSVFVGFGLSNGLNYNECLEFYHNVCVKRGVF
jgi:hypothetical protein